MKTQIVRSWKSIMLRVELNEKFLQWNNWAWNQGIVRLEFDVKSILLCDCCVMHGQEEWLDLQCEADEGRLEWISHKAVRRSISSQNAAGVSTRSNAKSENAMSGTIFPKLFRPDDSSAYEKGYHPSGNEAIGIRLSIWWADDSMYYPGVVIAYEKESGKDTEPDK